MPQFPVNIPFITGQDEGWDKKLLPVGPLRALKNMFMERKGRLIPRRACKLEGHTNEIPDDEIQGLVAPNYIVTDRSAESLVAGITAGPRRLYGYEQRPAGTVELDYWAEKAGAATFWQSAKVLNPHKDAGSGQSEPHVAFNSKGGLVRSYRVLKSTTVLEEADENEVFFDVDQVVFEVLDDEDQVVFRWESEFSTPTYTMARYKMVHSTVTDTAIIFFDLGSSTRNGVNQFWVRIQTVAPYNVAEANWPGLFLTSTEDLTGWDISAVEGEDAWLFAGIANNIPADIASLYKTPFTGGTWEQMAQSNPGMGREYNRGFSCCGVVGDYYFIGADSEDAGTNPSVDILRVNSGFTQTITFPFVGLGDEFDAPASAAQVSESGTIVTMGLVVDNTKTLLYRIVAGGDATLFGPNVDTQAVVYAGEMIATNPLMLGGDCVFVSVQSYISTADTDTEFELGVSHVITQTGYQAANISVPNLRTPRYRHPESALRGGRSAFAITTQDTYGRPDGGEGMTAARWIVYEEGTVTGIQSRASEVCLPGSPLTIIDKESAFPCGFGGPPTVEFVNALNSEGGQLTSEARYGILLIAEWRDANGRLWRSQPSVPRFVTVTENLPANNSLQIRVRLPVVAPSGFARVILYATKTGGTLLRYAMEWTMQAGTSRDFLLLVEPTDGARTPYTAEELPHEPPPDCSMVTRTRQRLWVAGIPGRPSAVQASWVIGDTAGINWSYLDNFFTVLPDAVTGICGMDDMVVAFTETGVFLISGDGPNAQGIGAFSPPQVIPTTFGCINPRSVVAFEGGVFYQSRRGIEVIGRGGGTEFVGEGVQDTVALYPDCLGSISCGDDSTTRWLMSGPDGSIVLVFDRNHTAWYVYEYDGDTRFISGGVEMRLSGMALRSVRRELNVGEDPANPGSIIATQSIRASGLNGWVYGKKFNILGEYLGPCTVQVEVAFDDQDYLARNAHTWTLDSEHYQPGDPVHLELHMPYYNWLSASFRLTTRPISAPPANTPAAANLKTFAANGITVYFEPAEAGPRRPSWAKG